ncbi:LacI family DNA-binding transcriptional regulator [Trujillonella humicola]|uniref:LacI family DNA-binding transcriptional regulator n=1 Tax=Trujillonella humicola TaxID=3383699 RepID=UPI003906B1A5
MARAAGVSPMTVSYVYSRPARVAAGTVERVRAAARDLGYPGPDPTARSLRRGRVGSLGVVLGERLSYAFDDPQAARFLAGVADVCVAEGVGLTLLPVTGGGTDVERVAEAVVDGLVVWTTSDDDPVLDAVADRGLPAVVHAGPAHRGLPVVAIDDRSAAAAVGALAFAGAQRPVVLGFPLDRARARRVLRGPDVGEVGFPVTRHRWEGFRDAWAQAGRPPAALRLAVCPVNDSGQGEDLTAELLAGDEPPDAVAAMSDELALGALRAVTAAGLAVPHAVAVTGWDDGDAAEAAGLTTVAQSLREQGARCARLVLGGTPPEGEPGWRVVVRSTTRPAPS